MAKAGGAARVSESAALFIGARNGRPDLRGKVREAAKGHLREIGGGAFRHHRGTSNIADLNFPRTTTMIFYTDPLNFISPPRATRGRGLARKAS